MSKHHDVPMVRIYGPSNDHGSWARVAAGMRSGLEQIGRLAGFYALEAAVNDLDDGLPVGHDAHLGVLIGPPSFANVLCGRGEHKRRAVLIAANSSWLPAGTMRVVELASTELLAPSEWSAEVVRSHAQPPVSPEPTTGGKILITAPPVSVWRHGVSDAFQPTHKAYAHGYHPDDYRVLHLASTSKERKSTVQLARAWTRAKTRGWLPPGARLDIAVSGSDGYVREALGMSEDGYEELGVGIRLAPRLNLSEVHMARLYQQYDLVCQPSRAEGFGLVPLEARCCGVPVCVTLCTGHAEHMSQDASGVVVIPHGEPTAIDDGPGAMAPTVAVDDIAQALRQAYERRHPLHDELLANVDVLRQVWPWKAVCQAWVDRHLQA